MKINKILNEKCLNKQYIDNVLNEKWVVSKYWHDNDSGILFVLETVKTRKDIKDFRNLELQEILEMDFEEIK